MGSAIKEKYSLQWQDFHANIATSFGDLRDEEEFLDVTLACDEDKQVMAHKVIISACSPYFKSMLVKQRSALHPVLIMPDTVRFEDVLNLLDFMYHGEVSVPSVDLDIFLNTAKQFKVRGLAEEEGHPSQPRMRNAPRPTFSGLKPRPLQASVPPDIRQRLPPGIQMVKRGPGGYEPSPEKRPRLSQPPGMQRPGQFMEQEEEDDITEIRDGDETGDYYDEYGNEFDGARDMGGAYEDESSVQPPPAAPASKLVGLLCPNCRTMCKGVPALNEHLKVCKGAAGASSAVRQPPSGAGPAARDIEEPQECHICDKPFKSHRTLDNHMKKQHGLAAPPKQINAKGRGRPKKSPATTPGDWTGDTGGYDGGYQDVGVAQPLQRGRPVGQVAPVRVGDGHALARASQPSTSAAGDPVRAVAANRGRGRGQPPAGRGQIRRPGGQETEDKPDLQKLGMKFGGQISITSSNQPQGKKSGPGDGGQGLSVVKMKGNEHVGGPVSIKDATSNKNGSSQPSSSGESSKAESVQAATPSVKEEPKDNEDTEAEVSENFDDYGDGDNGDNYEEEYVGPGAEYLDDPDFTGEDVDGDGMDVDLYSQYKSRGEGDYEEDEEAAPLDEEYEEDV